MLEITRIRAEKEAIIEGLKKRGVDFSVAINQITEKDNIWREKKTSLEQLQAESNKISKEIGKLFGAGKVEEANTAKAETQSLKKKEQTLKEEVAQLEAEIQKALYEIPQIPLAIVPSGKTEEDNEIVEEVGAAPHFETTPLPHWELANKYDIIDFELGVKVTGAGFPFYKGKGAKLQRALINFFLHEAELAGYTEYQTPILINEESGYGTGQLPDKEGQMYYVGKDDLYLIPTAEVPLTNMYRDVLLPNNDFSIKLTGYTPCFRREAGSYGSHVRGLNRLHQFDKVEIVRIEHPSNSQKALDEMIQHVKGLLEKLGLHYRILRLCGGDLGFTSAITYDFEVYSAAQERWLEVSSVSLFETYQSNRLKLRYKDENNKSQLCHTLNGSALALPRILAAILENNQTAEGINIPDVLHSFLTFDRIK